MFMVHVFLYKHWKDGEIHFYVKKIRFSSKCWFGSIPKRKLSDQIAAIFSGKNTVHYI